MVAPGCPPGADQTRLAVGRQFAHVGSFAPSTVLGEANDSHVGEEYEFLPTIVFLAGSTLRQEDDL